MCGGAPGKIGKLATWVESTIWEQATQVGYGTVSPTELGLLLDFSKLYDTLNYHFLKDVYRITAL